MKKQQFGGFAFVIFVVAAFVVVIASGGVYYYFLLRVPSADEQIFCTQEAKQCPDGSYVSRTGPQCAFAPCPSSTAISASQIPDDWKTYRNEKYGFEFKYPNSFKVVSEHFITEPTYDPRRDQFAGTSYVQFESITGECVPHMVSAQKDCWGLTLSIEESPLNTTGLVRTPTTLGGVSAERLGNYGESWNIVSIQAKVGHVWYVLSLSSSDSIEKKDTETLIKQVEESFKFIK